MKESILRVLLNSIELSIQFDFDIRYEQTNVKLYVNNSTLNRGQASHVVILVNVSQFLFQRDGLSIGQPIPEVKLIISENLVYISLDPDMRIPGPCEEDVDYFYASTITLEKL